MSGTPGRGRGDEPSLLRKELELGIGNWMEIAIGLWSMSKYGEAARVKREKERTRNGVEWEKVRGRQ